MSPPRLVDFHCHLDLYPNPDTAFAEQESAAVYTLAVTTTPRAWPRNKELTHKARYVRAALGLHPQVVAERFHELQLWERYLPDARYVGEVGLDAGPTHHRSLALQRRLFLRILQLCAEVGDRILSVHSVRATSDVLDLLEAHLPPDRGRVVLHWFTGTKADVQRAVAMGCYFSVNAAMLSSERHRVLVAALPGDRLLTETDGPFIKSGQTTRIDQLRRTVEDLALLRSMDAESTAALILANMRRLVSTV